MFLHLDDAPICTAGGAHRRAPAPCDLHQARRWRAQLAQPLSGDLPIRDWTRRIATGSPRCRSKTMMFIILTLIVAVAAFNLVSTW